MSIADLSSKLTPDDVGELLGPDVLGLSPRPTWHALAACRGHGTAPYFPALGETTEAAKATCETCPVRLECLREALEHPELTGVWGGTTHQQRRLMRREEKLSA